MRKNQYRIDAVLWQFISYVEGFPIFLPSKPVLGGEWTGFHDCVYMGKHNSVEGFIKATIRRPEQIR